MLQEYIQPEHWNKRVQQRSVEISNIIYPSAIFEGVENKEELKEALDDRVKKSIRQRIVVYQTLHDPTPAKYYTTIIITIQLKKGNTTYTPIIETVTEGKKYVGNTYIGFTHNNALLTLENIPQEKVDPYYLTQLTIKHWKNKGVAITESDVEITKLDNFNATLSVDSVISQLTSIKDLPTGVPKTPEGLPYKVKRDYVKSTPGRPNFVTFKDLGRGEIVQSEQGMGGKWNDVTIAFPTGRKTFKTMYATGFF